MTKRLFFPAKSTICLALIFFLSAVASIAQSPHPAAPASQSPATLVLHGVVRGSQNQTYVKVPFRVPAGTERVTLTFAYTEREQHTALDLGLLDTAGLRCWSGGNKSLLTVGISDATPSCLPGPIPAGTWNVLIGVPNIRPAVVSHYTIHVDLTSTGEVAKYPADLLVPLRSGPAWYRGDLHMHTGHSDGSCPNQTGKMIPCPVFVTVDAAARRGLDFIAITDHNASSQYNVMRELQPYFDKVLLIPGREVTTFQGHMNFLGSTDYIDFRLGSPRVPDVNTILRSAARVGAIMSINHPADPTGEACMGCGWSPSKKVDMRLFTAVEAVNGGSERFPNEKSDIPFWNEQLNTGCRLAGIGGSDNHRPMMPLRMVGSVGSPTTVVYAANLSVPAILDGVRAGHVFIDIDGTPDRLLEVAAESGGQTVHAGDQLSVSQGQTVSFSIHAVAVNTGKILWIEDGQPVALPPDASVTSDDQTLPVSWTSDGQRHWFRAEVARPDGKLWLVGNPVYINWTLDNHCGR